ncbi:hypothetical protein SAMN02745945_00655 [Peptoclostridium litorale DSM 5388]|uniref:Uncharacterized protein n=1 Tax=Peptoclostridium litorale DSM 5388 TaxID=1121324 RepID=A0A069RFK9_PEPLI|nr:hypothetical protein [Peptoclostridium litorale]KDR94980.1 hypothetical protein CLIT_11c00070 [Peptoclostridium litorale DSM 5388]SIN77130.1 hypothetical protein SAMN02745945_00655 [Peptoclostridium litorale DSM 5388]
MNTVGGKKLEVDIGSDVMKIYDQSAHASVESAWDHMDSYYVGIRGAACREEYMNRLSQIDMQLYRTNFDYMFSSIGALGFYISIRNATKAYQMHEYIPLLLFSGVCTLIIALGVKFTVFNMKNYAQINRKNKLIRHEKELLIQILQEFDCKE